MSLEARLESLEAAVVKLTAVLEKSPQPESVPAPSGQSEPEPAAAPKKARKAKPEPKAEPAPTDPAVTLEQVIKPLVLKTVEKAGREVAVAILGKLGAKNASSLAVEQYDDAITALKAAVEAAETAATAEDEPLA